MKFVFLEENPIFDVFFLYLPQTYTDKGAIRASGLIPVFPLTTINKDTQLPMCIEEQAINY